MTLFSISYKLELLAPAEKINFQIPILEQLNTWSICILKLCFSLVIYKGIYRLNWFSANKS